MIGPRGLGASEERTARTDLALVAVTVVGLSRLIDPPLVWLVPALAVTWLLVSRTLALEARLNRAHTALTDDERTALLVTVLLVAFLGFTGVAAMVPGGLVQTGGPLPEGDLLVLTAADAAVAGLLGYRIAALRVTRFRDAFWQAVTYAAAIAIGAAAIRAMAIPRLVGPALLTLAFYLWDAFISTAPSRRRDGRWIGRVALLVGLGVIVAAWNLLLRT